MAPKLKLPSKMFSPCKIIGGLTLVLTVTILVLVILISRGVLGWGNKDQEEVEKKDEVGGLFMEPYAAPAVVPSRQHYLVAYIKMRGCPACINFTPHFERAAVAAREYFNQKPTCPKHIMFATVEVSSREARTLFAAGLKRPDGVPHVALFKANEQGKPIAFMASLPDSAYTYSSMWKWLDDSTAVDKCSGWLDLGR